MSQIYKKILNKYVQTEQLLSPSDSLNPTIIMRLVGLIHLSVARKYFSINFRKSEKKCFPCARCRVLSVTSSISNKTILLLPSRICQ